MKIDILSGDNSQKNSNGTSAVRPEDAEVLEFMQNSIYRDEPAELEELEPELEPKPQTKAKLHPGENPWQGKFDRRKTPR